MLAIIDGDVLAYQACRSRYKKNNDVAHGFTRISQAEMHDQVEEAKQTEFTKEQDIQYMMDSWQNFQDDLRELLDKLFCTDYIMAVKGEGCFRKLIYSDYKMNRHGADKPKRYLNDFVPRIRKLAIHEGLAVPANMREADDLIRTWAEEARRHDKPYIICSIDKDLRCIPGKHYVMHYDEKKKKILNISPEDAQRFYYEQLLKGDPTDNIPGVPRVGEVKAHNLISECNTEEEMQEAVVGQYYATYGEEWFGYFLLNAKLIHLQLHDNDYFDPYTWPIIRELK